MSKAGVRVIQATSIYYNHDVPSEVERATITPEQEAIFKYLSSLGPAKFVEFISDVLVQVEGHELIDRTDGSGDEKQDILTKDRTGRRHLTQVKHVQNPGDKANGDDLDVLMVACLRKDCASALYVTNGDLTVQGKRYVTDREYTRGSSMPAGSIPSIEYWNGRRIWERVSRNNSILNKWFSGMAQAHALRRFFIDVAITEMPSGRPSPTRASEVATGICKSLGVAPAVVGDSIEIPLSRDLTLGLSDWFRGSDEFGMPFSPPASKELRQLRNRPVSTVRVHALVSDSVGAYDVAALRDQIVGGIATAIDPPPGPDGWLHVACSTPTAFVFLQDIGRAVLVEVGEPQTYVRVRGELAPERAYALRPGHPFDSVPDPDHARERIWYHGPSATTAHVLVDQALHPAGAYDLHLRQLRLVDDLRNFAFVCVEGADEMLADTVRRLSHPAWVVLRGENGDMFVALPPDSDRTGIERIRAVLLRRRVRLLDVRPEDRTKIIAQIDTSPIDADTIVSDESAAQPPIALHRRTFWLWRNIPVAKTIDMDDKIVLVKCKLEYESRHGHDWFTDRESATVGSEELGRLLYDPLTFRGSHMLDVAAHERMLTVHLRIREGLLDSADALCDRYLAALDVACTGVVGCLGRTS